MDEKAIGANIRGLRERAGLTATEIAKRAELSKSTVSKIETGQISPPISTLMRIAQALNEPLAEFFVEPDADPPYVLTRNGEGNIITRNGTRFGYSYEALALGLRHKRVEPFVLTIKPGDPTGAFRHGGQEFIYMLSGRMEFTMGRDKVKLGPGDALYFDPTLEHETRLVGRRPARFLCIFIQKESAPERAASARRKR